MPVVRIDFHNVPENRLPAGRDLQLGSKFRFLPQPGARASAQNNDRHPESPTPG
jgi:hypothetical protein